MKKWVLLVCVLSMLSGRVAAQNLTVITGTWAPYDMEENGKITGIGTEIVQATLEKAGIKAEITLYPLARALKMVTEEPNTLLYTLVQSPEREPLFKWVGPIVPPVKIVMHKLKTRTDIVLNSLDDAKKYKIGVTNAAVGHQYLLKQGFEDGKQIEPVASNQQSVKKLFAGRIDLEVSTELTFLYEAKQLGLSYSDVEIAFVLFANDGYMCFNKQTPDDVVDRVRTAFEQIKAAGTVDAIVAKYLKMYQ